MTTLQKLTELVLFVIGGLIFCLIVQPEHPFESVVMGVVTTYILKYGAGLAVRFVRSKLS